MAFRILYKERARKDLKSIPKEGQGKFLTAMENLKRNPFQGKKLQGKLKDLYSMRIWPYRIIYQIMKKELTILVIHIGHRQGVYR